jgi:glycogen debranching enzyme
MSTLSPATAEALPLAPVSAEEALGYAPPACQAEPLPEDSLVLKHDRLFLVVDRHGDAGSGACGVGLFHDDTRVLSRYALRFAGGPLSLLSSQVPRVYRAQIDLAATDQAFGGVAWDVKNSVHVRRELVVGDRLVERVTITSYLPRPVDYWMELEAAADFADIFEVRGLARSRRGQYYAPQAGPRSIAFAYRGVDGALVRSCIRFSAEPDDVDAHGARWRMRLEPGALWHAEWEVVPSADDEPGAWAGRDLALGALRAVLDDTYQCWRGECSHWTSDVDDLDTTLGHAVEDLRALYTEAEGEDVVSAGIPWYSTVFGRDSAITSLQTLAVNPAIARDTLRFLARRQGRREDAYTEEEPGKILHELRRGELARAGEVPHLPYYGSVDATPLWLVLLHETWRWTGDDALVAELLPHAERALEWIDRYGDRDGDGLVEYHRVSEKGLANQGWKDSGDGVPFPDGTLPEGPIALVEVQGYVYDARLRAAELFERVGRADEAARQRERAAHLRDEVVRRFWLDDAGTFALALDGAKRPLPTVTSNAGHLLWSGLPDPGQATRMAGVLLGRDLFSGWGIRTLSAAHPVYNPMSYHDGSVWPHDNALVVAGLARYGHAEAALPVLEALHEAARHMSFHRLPELFCGMPRTGGMRPVLYPVSCSPQAWASGAFFLLLQAVLGLMPDAPRGVLHVRDPQLPAFLRELTVLGLRVGDSRVTLHFRRHAGRTLANLLAVEDAPLRVQIDLR